MNPKPFITNHAIDRFKERFAHKYPNLDSNNKREVINKICQILNEAKEDKSYLNDSLHLVNLYEKYGYGNHFRFMCNQGIVFVATKLEKGDFIVTCYSQEIDKHIAKHHKFSKKQKKHNFENVIALEDAKAKGWNIGL